MAYTKQELATTTTNSLPEEVSEVVRAAAIEQIKWIAKLRDFGFVDNSPVWGDRVYIYNILDQLQAAEEVAEASEPNYDEAGATKGSADIVKLMKAFKISWEADNLKQINVRAGQSRQATNEVFDLEDQRIALGLISGAGNTNSSPSDWSSATADPVADIRNGKRLLRDDGFTGDTMLLNPTNNEELDSVIASNTWYSVTEQTVRTGEPFPFMGLKRQECRHQTLGTVTIFKSGQAGAFHLAEAKPLTVHMFDDNDAQVTKVQVYERVAPIAVVRPNAIATLVGV